MFSRTPSRLSPDGSPGGTLGPGRPSEPQFVGAAGLVAPLAEFYALRSQTLPPVSVVEPLSLPEPQRSLLVHEADMTRTLERFYHKTLHLRVLQRRHEKLPTGEERYGRELVLVLDGSEQPVEFGAIQIHLDRLPPATREQILAEKRPLGAILNESGLTYHSRPAAFLRVASDQYITESLGLRGTQLLFGRRNRLLTGNGDLLADIVELLPPARS